MEELHADQSLAARRPFLSLLTPAYNVNRYYVEMVDSIRRQTFTDYEHLVLNDGSDEAGSSLDTLREHCDGHNCRLFSREHQGLFATQNDLLKLARGEFFAFLHADDLIHDDRALERAVAILKNEPETDVLYGKLLHIDADGIELPVQRDFIRKMDVSALSYYPGFISMGCLFVRRSIILQSKVYFEDCFRYAGDWMWLYRISRITQRFRYSPDTWFKYRVHPASVTRSMSKAERGREINEVMKFTGGSRVRRIVRGWRDLLISRTKLLLYIVMSRDVGILGKLRKK